MVKGCVQGCPECERLDKIHLDACCFFIKHHWDFTIFAERKVEKAGAELEAHIAGHRDASKLPL
jgi:hypothetical protein